MSSAPPVDVTEHRKPHGDVPRVRIKTCRTWLQRTPDELLERLAAGLDVFQSRDPLWRHHEQHDARGQIALSNAMTSSNPPKLSNWSTYWSVS